MTDLRTEKIRQLSEGRVANKGKIIIEAFGLIIKEDITDNPAQTLQKYKDRMQCFVNIKGIETYCFDNIPVLEIYPLQTEIEGNIMTAKQNYRVLWEGV
jgi:hypothetical protein